MSAVLFVLVLMGSGLLSLIAVAASIRAAQRWQFLDHPDSPRKTQQQPVPKLGGIAVAIAFSVAALVVLWTLGESGLLLPALYLLLPALTAAAIGYVDDLRHIQPIIRLLFQGGVGTLAWALGTRAEVTGISWLDLVLTVLWFMILINGINLLDNSDGLAATTVLVSAAGAGVVAILFGQELVSLLAVALVGVCAGYLRFNWFPARVYLGDSGAYFLGAMLAILIIGLRPSTVTPWVGVVLAVLLAALPILDTAYVLLKRLRAGVHPFTAGRDHLAHVLQDRGRSVAGSVITLQAGLFVTTAVAIGLAAAQIT